MWIANKHTHTHTVNGTNLVNLCHSAQTWPPNDVNFTKPGISPWRKPSSPTFRRASTACHIWPTGPWWDTHWLMWENYMCQLGLVGKHIALLHRIEIPDLTNLGTFNHTSFEANNNWSSFQNCAPMWQPLRIYTYHWWPMSHMPRPATSTSHANSSDPVRTWPQNPQLFNPTDRLESGSQLKTIVTFWWIWIQCQSIRPWINKFDLICN